MSGGRIREVNMVIKISFYILQIFRKKLHNTKTKCQDLGEFIKQSAINERKIIKHRSLDHIVFLTYRDTAIANANGFNHDM